MMNAELKKTFCNPPAIYRGAPFWAWNHALNKDQLLRQIDCFQEMGLGGFHMHSRTGLDTEYLGAAFMERVKACTAYAKEKKMLAWLYDEDRFPSGAAGGLVTRDERWRARHLLFTPTPYGSTDRDSLRKNASRWEGQRTENGELLAVYAVTLKDGRLAGYRRLDPKAPPAVGETRWYAYLETARPQPWYNHQTYVDTLNPEAVRRFLDVTHERYAEAVGAEFGRTIPAIFTDEPQFVHKQTLTQADGREDVILPWTSDLAARFLETRGGDLLGHLPELFWELPGGALSVWRYRYHEYVAERFAAAFADVVGQWCRNHGIALTGHLMHEPTLTGQTAASGEAMRSYRSFDIPGIDVLNDRVESEFSTAKQAQSAARQFGCSGVLSELYGVTNWDFDFAGHKRQGDWQAALGVTYRVQHLAWLSMAGEAKRDYPASIGYQSPWWREYRVVEDHFARLNLILSRGKPVVRVGVLHPIESFWLCWGPEDHTRKERMEREQQFADSIRWMLYGLVDFDFIAESLLPRQEPRSEAGGFRAGCMAYDVVVVPPLRTLRSTTLARLEAFADGGGRIVFMGAVPDRVDAEPSERPARLAERCETIPFSRTRLLNALAPHADVRLLDTDGAPVEHCLYQLRQEGEERYLFLCNTRKTVPLQNLTLRLNGEWRVARLDTHTGAEAEVAARYPPAGTEVSCELAAHGALLLHLAPGRGDESGIVLKEPEYVEVGRLKGPVPITLSEPNVLLFEKADWRLDNGPWQPTRQILDLDPLLRRRLNLPAVHPYMAQPWTDTGPVTPAATVSLRLGLTSDVAVQTPELALENAGQTDIRLDGHPVPRNITGYFTDEAIGTVRLPDFDAGRHTLELTLPYTRKTYLEWVYLLGDFGVDVNGDSAALTAPVRELAFGDWTTQGLPFYAGNVTYHCAMPKGQAADALRIPHFKGALVKARINGVSTPLAFAPFRVPLPSLQADAPIDLTVFGNRVNAFGQVHNMAWKTDATYMKWGPGSWRTTGDNWSDEYVLRPMGLLSGPILEADKVGTNTACPGSSESATARCDVPPSTRRCYPPRS